MNTTRGWAIGCAVALALGGVTACGDEDSVTLDLPHFNGLTRAPEAIQKAARAVVRVHPADSYGTGSYISDSGLLLTNNHVLGAEVCAAEGCYVELSPMHQRGEKRQDSVTYFAKPVTIDPGLDVAVVQLVDPETMAAPSTPDYLKFDARTSVDLLDEHVTIVGHPEGNLKKWTDGTVVDADGKWLTTTAFILPGDSGSPILDDDGKIVGLVHRGPASLDLITGDGINTYSVGSESAAVKAAVKAQLPDTLVHVSLETTREAFLENHYAYLNANRPEVLVAGVQTDALEIFGEACDVGLSRSAFASIDAMEEAVAPCYAALSWLECRADYLEQTGRAQLCPSPTIRDAWRQRIESVSTLSVDLNGMPIYGLLTHAVARLEDSADAGRQAARASLETYLDTAKPRLDISLAYYLAASGVKTYEGKSIAAYITNYGKVSFYELDASFIAYAATYLAADKLITTTQLESILTRLVGDPGVSLGDRLAIEDLQYEFGLI